MNYDKFIKRNGFKKTTNTVFFRMSSYSNNLGKLNKGKFNEYSKKYTQRIKEKLVFLLIKHFLSFS